MNKGYYRKYIFIPLLNFGSYDPLTFCGTEGEDLNKGKKTKIREERLK